MAIDYESIGRRIKQCRAAKNMSQEELGVAVSVNSQHISNIEGGRRYPSLELIVSIANALGVSADDLLADVLTYPGFTVGKEIHDLLLDCSNDEKEMFTRIAKFMKELFSEFKI